MPEAVDLESSPDALPVERASLRVLVAYATKHGSTREIGEAIAAVLRDEGLDGEARPAADGRGPTGFGAVVLGSGLYSATWLREANRFVRVHRAALDAVPVWLFSSGPLDHSAEYAEIPMTKNVVEAIDGLIIRGHRTFGGRLREDSPEVAAGILATHHAGDFRDWAAIRSWARGIAAALR
jgi:menaquinone-dependent protoporphyrinogen oxidase